jgi:hypothetical protein
MLTEVSKGYFDEDHIHLLLLTLTIIVGDQTIAEANNMVSDIDNRLVVGGENKGSSHILIHFLHQFNNGLTGG